MFDIEDIQRYQAISSGRAWRIHDAIKHERVMRSMDQATAERLAGEMSALSLSIPLAVREHRFVLLHFDATSPEEAYDPEPFRPDGQNYSHCDNCRTIWQVEMIQQNPDYSWVCPLCYRTAETALEA